MAALKWMIVDGYNLGHKLGLKVSAENLEFVRSKVETLVLSYCLKLKSKATIVYDGKGILPHCELNSLLTIEFTPSGKSADNRIKELIDKKRGKGNALIVSSDSSIQQYAKLSGFKYVLSEQFIKEAEGITKEKKHKNLKSHSTLNPNQEKPSTVSQSDVANWLKLFNS